jgi:hypothetical protein
MNRRQFLALTGAGFAMAAESPSPLLFFAPEEGRKMREFATKDTAVQQKIRRLGERAMKDGPWSVTYHRPAGVDATVGPNDYYSEGPYWWPDPKNPKGPYIRKDGERNPERFMGNRGDIGSISEAVLALGMNAYFLNDAASAQRAAKVLSVWFVDPKTRMNPNLEFGQAVRGHNTGRGTGIIDTIALIHCAIGASLAGASAKLDLSGVRQWYADYVKWLTTSEKGLDEKKAGNNHATWWTAQVAAFSTFSGDVAVRRVAYAHYRDWLVPSQVQPDGSCPREEERTASLSYSTMNLDGYSVLCRLGQLDGENLWKYKTSKGIGIEKAFYYLMPFVLDPAKWTKQQISSFQAGGTVYLGLAGLGLPSPELVGAYRKLPRSGGAWVQLVDLLIASAG